MATIDDAEAIAIGMKSVASQAQMLELRLAELSADITCQVTLRLLEFRTYNTRATKRGCSSQTRSCCPPCREVSPAGRIPEN